MQPVSADVFPPTQRSPYFWPCATSPGPAASSEALPTLPRRLRFGHGLVVDAGPGEDLSPLLRDEDRVLELGRHGLRGGAQRPGEELSAASRPILDRFSTDSRSKHTFSPQIGFRKLRKA